MSVALRDCFAVGLNVTAYAQLPFAASTVPHVVPTALIAKSPGLVPPMLRLKPALTD